MCSHNMRITGGIFGGRKVRIPNRGVRPTQSRVREAIFSSLAATVPGARVLDLFAGSGALGLEAWSRGAEQVVFVDKSPVQCRIIQDNIRALAESGPGPGPCIPADAVAWLKKNEGSYCFDLIFADPPYGQAPAWLEKTLHALEQHSMLAPGGRLVFEMAVQDPMDLHPPWQLVKDKTYGKTRVLQIMKTQENPE